MRVWVDEGVNRARTLLLAMLIVGFTVGVLGPMGVWLAVSVPHARDDSDDAVRVIATAAAMFV